MAKIPYFPFYPGDWLSSQTIMLMSYEQRGIYITLLAHSWLTDGCTIPIEKRLLQKLCPGAKWKNIEAVVESSFMPHGSGVGQANPRLLVERSEAVLKSQKAREAYKHTKRFKKLQSNDNRTIIERSSIQIQTHNQNHLKEEPKDIVGQGEKPDVPPYASIIEDLNYKTGKSFKHNSSATKKLIHTRWQEGFILKDFLDVHSNMAGKWLNDEKMKEYLRPITLYGTKFESYLNANSKGGMSRAEQIMELSGLQKRTGAERSGSLRDITPGGNQREEITERGVKVMDAETGTIPEVEN